MKKYILFCLLIIPLNFIISQDCSLGDCENGYGIKKYADATYSGFWKNGSPDGLGFMKYQTGNAYVGEFKGNLFEGDGAYFMANGEKYFGEFKEGKQDGVGVFQNTKAETWAYHWAAGEPGEVISVDKNPNNPPNCTGDCVNGYGKIDLKNGRYIQAIFKDKLATYGQIRATTFEYMGYINKKKPTGFGIMATAEGRYFGYFKEGEKHGKGISVNLKEEVSGDLWNMGEIVRVNLDASEFKKQLKQLLDLSIEDIKANEIDRTIPKDSVDNHLTLKKTFLTNYRVTYKQQPYVKDKIFVKFPNYGPNKITEEQVIKLLGQCEFLTKDEEFDNEYNYKDGKKVRPMLPFLVNNYLLLRIEYPHKKN